MNTRDKPTCPAQSHPVTSQHAQRVKGKPSFKLNFDALNLNTQKKSATTENFGSKTKGLSESTNIHTIGRTPNTKLKLNLDELNVNQKLQTETITKSSRHEHPSSNNNKHRRIMSNREDNFFMQSNNTNNLNTNSQNLQNIHLPRNYAGVVTSGSGGVDLQAAIADAKNHPKKIFKSVVNPPKVGNFISDVAETRTKIPERKNVTANFNKPKKSNTKLSGVPISKKS